MNLRLLVQILVNRAMKTIRIQRIWPFMPVFRGQIKSRAQCELIRQFMFLAAAIRCDCIFFSLSIVHSFEVRNCLQTNCSVRHLNHFRCFWGTADVHRRFLIWPCYIFGWLHVSTRYDTRVSFSMCGIVHKRLNPRTRWLAFETPGSQRSFAQWFVGKPILFGSQTVEFYASTVSR